MRVPHTEHPAARLELSPQAPFHRHHLERREAADTKLERRHETRISADTHKVVADAGNTPTTLRVESDVRKFAERGFDNEALVGAD